MAKVHEEVIIIKLSKLLKEREIPGGTLADEGLLDNLEAVVQELVEPGVTVEAEKA